MSKENTVQMNGVVIATNRGSATVELTNGAIVRGIIAGRLMKNRIKILTGNKVALEISRYDRSKGRIVFRFK